MLRSALPADLMHSGNGRAGEAPAPHLALVVKSRFIQHPKFASMPAQDKPEAASVSRPDRPDDERYDAQRVETKWFERWQQDASLYAAESDSTKKKYYVLEML